MDKLTTVRFASRGPQRSFSYKNLDVWLSYVHRCVIWFDLVE
jgi:hypothetical protein